MAIPDYNRMVIACPIDGLSIDVRPFAVRGDPVKDTDAGRGHVHLDIDEKTLTCASGHEWRVAGLLDLWRVA